MINLTQSKNWNRNVGCLSSRLLGGETEPLGRQNNHSRKPIVRKPVENKNLFGFEYSSSSNDESDPDMNGWSRVERKLNSDEKKKRATKRKDVKKRDTACKASKMVSLGPITAETVDYFRQDNTSYNEAKILAVKELLQYKLDYDVEELEALTIDDTKMSNKGDDIINVAMSSEDEVRDIYKRKAECKEESITVRCYIPPSFYKRFMFISEVCAEKRKLNKI